MYQDVLLHIDGQWRAATGGRTIPVLNPATEEVIGTVPHASQADMDEALAAADHTTASNDDDGFARAVEGLLLHR